MFISRSLSQSVWSILIFVVFFFHLSSFLMNIFDKWCKPSKEFDTADFLSVFCVSYQSPEGQNVIKIRKE